MIFYKILLNVLYSVPTFEKFSNFNVYVLSTLGSTFSDVTTSEKFLNFRASVSFYNVVSSGKTFEYLYSMCAHTATRCNTLQHDAAHCNALRYIATHCNTLLLRMCTGCVRTLQHTATHCNALQHTATHCNCNTMRQCAVRSEK